MARDLLSNLTRIDPLDFPYIEERPVTNNQTRQTLRVRASKTDVNSDFGQDTKGLIISRDDAIWNQIMNVLIVVVGEEQFEAGFGSLVMLRVFETAEASGQSMGVTTMLLEGDTIDALGRFMSDRIQVLYHQCSVEPLDDDDGYLITVVYQDLETGTTERTQFAVAP